MAAARTESGSNGAEAAKNKSTSQLDGRCGADLNRHQRAGTSFSLGATPKHYARLVWIYYKIRWSD